MMRYMGKNLDVLKPKTISMVLVVLALLQAFDVVGLFSRALFAVGRLTVSVGTLLMLVLAVLILLDARR